MKTYKLTTIVTLASLMSACGNAEHEYDATGVFETTEIIVSAQGNGEVKQLILYINCITIPL